MANSQGNYKEVREDKVRKDKQMNVKQTWLRGTRSMYWNAWFSQNMLMIANYNEGNLGKKKSIKQKPSVRYKSLH